MPRITRLLALALKFEELIESGVVSNYAAVAQVAQVSRSRVTQMTSLLNLAPDIQEEILFLPAAEARQLRISEPSLRKLTATLLWNQQREQWRTLRSPRRLLRSFVCPWEFPENSFRGISLPISDQVGFLIWNPLWLIPPLIRKRDRGKSKMSSNVP